MNGEASKVRGMFTARESMKRRDQCLHEMMVNMARLAGASRKETRELVAAISMYADAASAFGIAMIGGDEA